MTEIRELSGIEDEVFKNVISEIAREKNRELYQFGLNLSNMAKAKVKGLFSKESKPAPTKGTPTIKTIQPILDPIQKGVMDGMQDVVKDTVKFTAIGLGSLFFLGFIVGRITKKKA